LNPALDQIAEVNIHPGPRVGLLFLVRRFHRFAQIRCRKNLCPSA
jgi:hypothetical protein